MGYPMTWRRVISRNGIKDPVAWLANVNTLPLDDVSSAVSGARRERISKYAQQGWLLSDDLNRLERDGTDEKAIAEHIAKRISIDINLVAAVLKEFFDF